MTHAALNHNKNVAQLVSVLATRLAQELAALAKCTPGSMAFKESSDEVAKIYEEMTKTTGQFNVGSSGELIVK